MTSFWQKWQGGRWMLPCSVLVTTLAIGCGEQEPSAPAPVMASASLEDPKAPRAEEAPQPTVADFHVTSLEELHEASKSRFEMRLDPRVEHNYTFREIVLTPSERERLILRDDGLEGDERAGDLVFSGLGLFNFVELQKEQDRIRRFQASGGKELVFTTFENRAVVKRELIEPLSMESFRPGIRIPIKPIGIAQAVQDTHSLIITHPSVVGDPTRTWDPCTNTGNPNGKWTFNYLMTEMANQPVSTVAPAQFVRTWLNTWTANQSINGWSVPARSAPMNSKIITPWPKVGTDLNLAQSPFKLVAIVNRLDLAKGNRAYGGGNAGEARFIFAAVNKAAGSGACTPQPFLVIFEYGPPINGCAPVRAWAQQWANLSTMTLGSLAYNQALENLTEQFVPRNLAPSKPQGSAINQVRTNENFLVTDPWELREFRLRGPTTPLTGHFALSSQVGHLNAHSTAQQPQAPTELGPLFPGFVNDPVIQGRILATPPRYEVPLLWSSSSFLGGRGVVPFPPSSVFWNSNAIVSRQARHVFSLNTCEGCHGGEVNTFFTHINQNGNRSPFLSGPLSKADAADGTPIRTFDEMGARAQNLDQVANQSCLPSVLLQNIGTAVH